VKLIPSSAAEINRLHTEASQLAGRSRQCLDGALDAAWQAGQLLTVEKARTRRLGAGAWGLWVEQQFDGSLRTAQRYILLAQLVPEISALEGLSLRQAYLRLGIATEPKTPAKITLLPPLPGYVLHANRLLRALKRRGVLNRLSPAQAAARRTDLREVYNLLRPLYEPPQGTT
jgi:hypothetical protein